MRDHTSLSLDLVGPETPESELTEALQRTARKLNPLIEKVQEVNPGPHPLGLTGIDVCPFCEGTVRFQFTSGGGLYLECLTSSCFQVHARGGAKRREPLEQQGRLL